MKQFLSSEDIERLREEARLEREAAKAAETPVSRVMTAIMLTSFVGGIVGAIAASVCGAEMLAGAFAIQVFAVFGFGFFVDSLNRNISRKILAFSFPLFMAVGAAALLVGFGAYRLLWHEVIMEEQYQLIKGVLVKGTFIIGGLMQIVPTAYYRLILRIRCTEPVSAVCMEHNLVKTSEVNGKPVYGTSLIWQYYFDGGEYIAEDNSYIRKGELPEVGATADILIDPDKPERMLSQYCRLKYGFKLFLGIALIAVGLFVIK